MANGDDLALDIEELKQLQSIAKWPRVVLLISSEIRNLEKLSNAASSAPSQQIPSPIPAVNTLTPVSSAP